MYLVTLIYSLQPMYVHYAIVVLINIWQLHMILIIPKANKNSLEFDRQISIATPNVITHC